MSGADNESDAALRVIELPPVLDLKAASPLAAALLARKGAEVRIDASRVRRLGGQCLQVLLSAALTWKADEAVFSLVHPSPDFVAGLNQLGISPAHFLDQEFYH